MVQWFTLVVSSGSLSDAVARKCWTDSTILHVLITATVWLNSPSVSSCAGTGDQKVPVVCQDEGCRTALGLPWQLNFHLLLLPGVLLLWEEEREDGEKNKA